MEEVVLDSSCVENSIYVTAMPNEFTKAISLDDDEIKDHSSESVIFEEVQEDLPSPQNQDLRFSNEFPEQPPPEFMSNNYILQEDYLTSTAREKHFEDIQLEETLKFPIKPTYTEEEKKPENLETEEKHDISFLSTKEKDPQIKVKDSIMIKSTKLVKSGLFGINNYYIYEIVSNIKDQKFVVFRRFRDFEWLNSTLKESFKGLSIPPLPNKTIKFLQDASEAEIRRIQLEKILTILQTHSTLKKSQQLYMFLTVPDSDFAKVKETVKKPQGKFKYNDLEDAIDQIISKIQAKMNQIFHFRIIPFNKDLLEIQQYINTLEVPSYFISTHFDSNLSYQEKSSLLFQSIHSIQNSQFSKSMQILKNSMTENFRDLKLIRQQLNTENLKIEALQGALNDYKNILKKYSELEALMERKVRKSYRNVDDTEKYLVEIQRLKREINTLEAETNKIEKNVKEEKIWFQADRDEKFEQLVVKIVEVNLKKACKEEEFWLNFKHNVGWDS